MLKGREAEVPEYSRRVEENHKATGGEINDHVCGGDGFSNTFTLRRL